MQTNKQPKEPRSKGPDTQVEIVDVWRTIQGEGPFAGFPAIFVRLAGCNLECPFCDTDYTSNRQWYSVIALEQMIDDLACQSQIKPIVVITGGEPFRQPLRELVTAIRLLGLHVQIETNGTMFQPLGVTPGREVPLHRLKDPSSGKTPMLYVNRIKNLSIVCSPKTPTLHPKIMPYINFLKYIVSADNVSRHDGLPNRVLGSQYAIARPWDGYKGVVYVQPEDHQDPEVNKANIQAAVASCMTFGYRLSLQIHKIIGAQ